MESDLTLPRIQYDQHPAFSGLNVKCTLDDTLVFRFIESIDNAYLALLQVGRPDSEKVSSEFAAKVGPVITELEQYVLSAEMRIELCRTTKQAISQARQFLSDQLVFDRRRAENPTDPRALPANLTGFVDGLRTNGYYQCPVTADLASSVWRHTWWERAVLRKRKEASPARHCAMPLDPCSPAAGSIQRALHSKGIVSAVSHYMGCEMEWLYAALDFSHPCQNWYKNCYVDSDLPTAKTVYMHFDADPDIVKAMLYLSDVDAASGPFRYVRGSHRWRRSPFLFALHKGFDMEQTKSFPMEADRLDYKLGYYRPRFFLKDHRRDLLTLPSAFRGTTHFGDDIVDESDLSRRLLAGEDTFLGPPGTLIVFDGSAGIHRGSQVERGERWAVQIALRAVASRRQPPASRRSIVKAAIQGRMRYELSRAKDVISQGFSTQRVS